MKVFAVILLTLGAASALGSGPYLPSGWRPAGPAFYLPTEQKPADSPLKEVILIESEPAGSDSLREYGPPKIQETASQGLPDVVTEQTFFVEEEKSNVVENVVEEEVTTILNSEVPVTEAVTAVEELTPTEAVVAEVSTAAYEVEPTAAVEEKLAQVVVEEAKVEQEVQEVVEAVVNLENEVKLEQVQAVEATAEVKVNQEGSGSSAPEGFLEYGPPGFQEYGPPKDLVLLNTNEARRRRFSPKFRSQKKNSRH